MARFLHAATDNSQGGTTQVRQGDPLDIKDYGKDHGVGVESTVFVGDPPVGMPGPVNPDWIHPVTGLPMSVNPLFWVVEIALSPVSDPEFAEMLDPEYVLDELVQKHKFWLALEGIAPNKLTPPERAELTDTHRLYLNRGRALQVYRLRPGS